MMKQRSNEYWDRRAMERMAEYHRGADRTMRTLSAAYDAALANIQAEIDKIFNRYSRDGRMSPKEARQLLNTPLTPQERSELTEQMRKVRDPTIRQQMLNRLNSAAYRARITRLQALRENIHLQTKLLADIEVKITEKWYVDVIDEAFYRTMFDIQRGLGLGFRFDPMPQKVVQEILRNPWSGKHFSRRVWANTEELAKLLEERLTAGFMSGTPRRKLALELEERMNVGKHAANRLVRTETTYMANSAEMESYEEAEVDEYQFLATLDSRTSEICRKHDLKVYAVKEAKAGVNMPPLHPYCRSTTRAYFGLETLEGIQRRATDPETGRSVLVPASMSYEDWKQKYGT
ncbi:minor capsid protein [Paenibacillus thailandensis]|uniref:Minor capsid protein n=1 Tax=Paenibacillus thailandensis TaxID=393250 RepID=A0ABW5QT41_9BACL